MFTTNFKGDTVYILNEAWNGRDVFRLDGAIIRDDQASLTNRTARRPYAQTVVCHCQYQVTLQDAEVRAVIGSLRALTTEPVVIPLWPAITTWAEREMPSIRGGLMLAFKADWSQSALYAFGDAEPGWPQPSDLWTPALMGFINPTQPRMLSPDAALWDVDFQESSPAAYALRFIEPLQDVARHTLQDAHGKSLLGF